MPASQPSWKNDLHLYKWIDAKLSEAEFEKYRIEK